MTDLTAAPTVRVATVPRLRIGRRVGYAGAIALSVAVWSGMALAARAILG
jgi:hypothetical protein